ncbi:MAG: type 1 glutamine amidotransferase domain-containing protein [Verrucomicrobiota bacterium]
MRILAIVDHVYEDLELWYPKIRLEEEGWQVLVAGPLAGETYVGKHGYPCLSDAAISDVDAADFDGLLLPGGFAPDKLRRDEKVKQLTRCFNDANKMIAHICHAGWICISADILRGRRATSTVGIRDDMINAGAEWLDEALVVDGNQISSRTPKDLHVFAKAMVEYLNMQQPS